MPARPSGNPMKDDAVRQQQPDRITVALIPQATEDLRASSGPDHPVQDRPCKPCDHAL